MGKLLFGLNVLVEVEGIDNVELDLIQNAKKELIERFKIYAEDIFRTDEFKYVYLNSNIFLGADEIEEEVEEGEYIGT